MFNQRSTRAGSNFKLIGLCSTMIIQISVSCLLLGYGVLKFWTYVDYLFPYKSIYISKVKYCGMYLQSASFQSSWTWTSHFLPLFVRWQSLLFPLYDRIPWADARFLHSMIGGHPCICLKHGVPSSMHHGRIALKGIRILLDAKSKNLTKPVTDFRITFLLKVAHFIILFVNH